MLAACPTEMVEKYSKAAGKPVERNDPLAKTNGRFSCCWVENCEGKSRNENNYDKNIFKMNSV